MSTCASQGVTTTSSWRYWDMLLTFHNHPAWKENEGQHIWQNLNKKGKLYSLICKVFSLFKISTRIFLICLNAISIFLCTSNPCKQDQRWVLNTFLLFLKNCIIIIDNNMLWLLSRLSLERSKETMIVYSRWGLLVVFGNSDCFPSAGLKAKLLWHWPQVLCEEVRMLGSNTGNHAPCFLPTLNFSFF